MNKITKPVMLDETGQRIAAALEDMAAQRMRVVSLNSTELLNGAQVCECIGIPVYLSDTTGYEAYGITDSGWYIFARITAPDGITVSGSTTVSGADGSIITVGEAYVDVAVRFEVAAMAKAVTVAWGSVSESFVFRASDLAVRNLDYRTTFYIYDLTPFATWSYALTADATFAEGKNYYVKTGDVWEAATVQTEAYVLTADETFQNGKTYYTLDGEVYTAATVTVGNPVPADTYYEKTTVPVPAYYKQVPGYVLTADETFQEGTVYYTKDGDEYTEAEVTTGDPVPAATYYVQGLVWVQAEDGTFQNGVTYYTKNGTEYIEAAVTAGDICPAYYNHSKVTFSGMARNVTYQFDEIVDCPQEYVLPEIEDDGHGAWFEFRLRHSGSFSSTLNVPEGVKVATEHTQAETAGFNMVDLHYMCIDGMKIWRFMNTHSSIPT